jgi:hypothetical protein
MIVDTREESIELFDLWLQGEVYQDVEPERREWILKNIPRLKDQVLGCWCKPLSCHGDILASRADNNV